MPKSARRLGTAFVGVIAVVVLAASCTTPTTPGGTTTTTSPTNSQQFCEFWNKVEDTPPAATNAVLVKDDVVALAQDTDTAGTSCTDPNARVDLVDATLAEGDEVASEQGTTNTDKVAAVTGDEISAGAPVLDNLQLTALSAEITSSGIRLFGNVAVTLSGQTSTIGFSGTLASLDNWSITLQSNNLQIPGLTVSPVTFTGTLAVVGGVPSLTMSARATSVKVGDISVTGATIDLKASPATGVSATVSGSLKIGNSTVTGNVAVVFDRTGTLVSAKADVAAHLVGTQAGGSKIDLTGTVKLDGNATQTTVSFTGNGKLGDMVVNDANGSLTLGVNKATFTGVLDIVQNGNVVRFNGSIVWDGATAYTPYLNAQGSGEISGTLDDGQKVSVSGTLSTEVIGTQSRTVVTGAFQIGTLKANGSAVIETSGATTVMDLDAALQGAGFGATIAGTVVITDGRAETVSLDAAVTGSLKIGDLTVTSANLHIASTYGNPLDMTVAGHLQVGTTAALDGTVAASFGPDGTLLRLDGQIQGNLQLGSWALLNFSGGVVASSDAVTLTGSGGIYVTNFPIGITFNGTLTSKLTQPTWALSGTGRLKLGPIDVLAARVTLAQTAGMKATRVGFYLSIVGIPTYIEADIYLKATGGCSNIALTGGSFLARPLAALILDDYCPVSY